MSLETEIKQKQEELNKLKLQQERPHFILMVNNLSNKEKFKLVKDIEKAFNININVEKKLWLFSKASVFIRNGSKGFWNLKIDKYGIEYFSFNSYDHPMVKEEMKILIEIVKNYLKNDWLGISGLNDLQVPEIIGSGLNLIYV